MSWLRVLDLGFEVWVLGISLSRRDIENLSNALLALRKANFEEHLNDLHKGL